MPMLIIMVQKNKKMNRHKIGFLFVIILMLSAGLCRAQESILVQPAQEIINGSIIEPYTNHWRVSIIDASGNRKTVRYWTDYAHILELNGKKYLHRVQDLYDAEYNLQQTWINVVNTESLLPERFYSVGSGGSVFSIEFDGKNVTYGSRKEKKGFSYKTYRAEQQLYDWNLYGILLVGLPFETGGIYRIPYWSRQSSTEDILTVTIQGKEMVKTLSGREWKTVKMDTDKGLVFWLTKRKPYVIQLTMEMENGGTMKWEML